MWRVCFADHKLPLLKDFIIKTLFGKLGICCAKDLEMTMVEHILEFTNYAGHTKLHCNQLFWRNIDNLSLILLIFSGFSIPVMFSKLKNNVRYLRLKLFLGKETLSSFLIYLANENVMTSVCSNFRVARAVSLDVQTQVFPIRLVLRKGWCTGAAKSQGH